MLMLPSFEPKWLRVNTLEQLPLLEVSRGTWRHLGGTCVARSCNEVKECTKGHRRLGTSINNKQPEHIGKRHVTRLCSDAYGRGICRSNQESTNLRVGGNDENLASAESFHTAFSRTFQAPISASGVKLYVVIGPKPI